MILTSKMISLQRLAFFSVFSLTLGFSDAVSKVPVLIWSNSLLPEDLPPSLDGHSISTPDFQNIYIDKLLSNKAQHVLVFVQDRLSVEDFTQYSNAYSDSEDGAALHNIKEQMESHTSTHLSSVESPVAAIKQLKKKYVDSVQEVTAPHEVDSLSFEKPGLVIVHLPDVTLEEGEKLKQFRKNDDLIGALTSKAKHSGVPFTAYFTAEETSKIPVSYPHLGRHLLATNENTSTYLNFNNCSLFYTTGVYISLFTVSSIMDKTVEKDIKTFVNTSDMLPPNPTFTDDTSCLNMSASVNSSVIGLTYPGEITIDDYTMTNLTIKFKFFANTARNVWNISALQLTYKIKNGTLSMNITEDDPTVLSVPSNLQDTRYSYSCSSKYSTNYTQANLTEYKGNIFELALDVRFDNLQIQPFGSSDKFLDASDCVGFFTIGTLSGLMVTLILLLILTWGISMMVNIKTMDRFDDPKGKGITVNVSE
ncbi:V-type proton ATPase subunit S1-like [Lingula anatina]|uniref:V-type proton ATPase subunit S1-like n=2 Tax=Lingula anatina TaxID=7574 RepID=A0A1S3H3W9_LINAN|nr:V-type proton ATPase subunit S1-like [Lingula anatina]|eukprot:XP_013380835.1 V-type proton ATPase subunit S1-like [Lingula anatina]